MEFMNNPTKAEDNAGDGNNTENKPENEENWESREKDIKEFAREIFSEQLTSLEETPEEEPNEGLPSIRLDSWSVKNAISKLAGSKQFEEERVFDENMQRGLHLFLTEMLDFVKDNRENRNIEAFAEEIKENLFAISPDICEGLNLADHFELLAQITRMPELQGNIGMSSLGELVYKANRSGDESIRRILEKIEKAPASEKMDMLELSEAIFAQSLAEGWAENSAQSFKGIIEKFDEENKSFFIKSYLELVKERMDDEEISPTQGVVKMTGDRSNSRLQENQKEKEFLENIDSTEKIFSANRHLLPREKMVRIGKDAVAIIDHTNKPIEIAKVDPASFGKEPLATKPRDLQDLDKVIDAFNKNPSSVKFDVLLMIMSQNSLFPEKSTDSWEKLAQKWEETCGEIEMIQLNVLETPSDSNQPPETNEILNEDLAENGWLEILQDLRKANRLSEANKEKIIEGLSQKAQEIHTQQEEKFTEAEFMDYETLMQKYNYELMKNEDPEEIFLLLQHLHKPDMRQKIEEKLDIDLKQIPLAYQLHFLKFLSEKNEEEVKEVKDFLNASTSEENKENRIKSFLSLEAGENMGKNILEIGEKLGSEVADAIFEKYTQITDQIEKDKEEISQMFQKEKTMTPEEMRKIGENLLNRANKLMIAFSKDIEQPENIKDVESDIIRKLSKINSENVLFSSIFKTAYESGEIENFSEIKTLNLEIRNSTELSEAEKGEIKEIIENNYEEDRNRLERIIAGIEKSFADNISRWYLLKKQEAGEEKIISTMRFDRQKDGNLYAASFSVDPEFQNSAVGKAMNEKVLDSINETETTVAISKIGDPCSLVHVNRTGWIIKGIEQNKETGIFYYKIIRNKETRDAKDSREADSTELLEKLYNENSSLGELLAEQEEKFILKLDMHNQEDLEKIKEADSHGYAVTRLIPEEDSDSELYHLFEKTGY